MNYEEIEIQFRCQEALQEVQKKNTQIEIEQHEQKMKKAENMLEKVTLEQKPEQHSPSSLNSPAAEPEKDSSQDYNIFKHKMKTIKDIEFLMKNKAELFNVTPPNAKVEGKFGKTFESAQTNLSSNKISELSKIDPFSAEWTFSNEQGSKAEATDDQEQTQISKFRLD